MWHLALCTTLSMRLRCVPNFRWASRRRRGLSCFAQARSRTASDPQWSSVGAKGGERGRFGWHHLRASRPTLSPLPVALANKKRFCMSIGSYTVQ